MNLFFFLKAIGSDRKMPRTKVVRKNANRRRSETKGKERGQDSAGSSKRGFFRPFLIVFHFVMQKD